MDIDKVTKRRIYLLGVIDYLLEEKQKNAPSSDELVQKVIGMNVDCEIRSEIIDGKETSYLYIEVGGTEFEFGPGLVKYVFTEKDNYSHLCDYIERRSKERKETEKLEKLLAA